MTYEGKWDDCFKPDMQDTFVCICLRFSQCWYEPFQFENSQCLTQLVTSTVTNLASEVWQCLTDLN